MSDSPRAILLVEDNESDIELTRRAMQRSGFTNELTVAEDGQEALDYLYARNVAMGDDRSELPALVLLDLNMPRVDGLTVLRRIRADAYTKHLIVVILTSSVWEQDLVAAYDIGANSYIRKPVDFQEFSMAINQVTSYWLNVNVEPPVSGSGGALPDLDAGSSQELS